MMKSSRLLSLLLLIAPSLVHATYRTKEQRKDPSTRRARSLEEVCTVNHELAQTVTEMDVQISESITVHGPALFNVTFDSPQYGGSHFTHGWCIDWDRLIWTGDWKVDALSAYDGSIRSDAVDKPEMFPNLAYLINNFYQGQQVDAMVDGEHCVGTLGWLEIQGAIWGLVDHDNGTGTAYQQYRTECLANYVKYSAQNLGNNYELDCFDPFEQVPIVMIVDDDTPENVITHQVFISEVMINRVPNLCECGEPSSSPTEAPTGTPTTPPPPTAATPAPTPASGSGDPHFKTWTGEKFDYHGECDLVLVYNPHFNEGQGLRIHIRTTRVKYFSYIEKIAIQIGTDVMEFENDVNTFLINGKQVEENRAHHKTHFGGFVVRRDKKAISIRLHDEGRHSHNNAKIDLHTRKNGFPAVIVDGGNTRMLEHSLGLLGDWTTGRKMARDGKTEMVGMDHHHFAEHWQVRDDEPMLFSVRREPQYPNKCLPPKEHLHGRLGASHMRKEAEKACKHWKGDKEDCIFDVIATRDVEVAAEGHIVHMK